MRFTVCLPFFFPNRPFPEGIRVAAGYGYDAVEIFRDWTEFDLIPFREACEETGTELMSMCTAEFGMTGADDEARWLKGIEQTIEACRTLNCRHMITQTGKDTGEDRALQYGRVLSLTRKAVPMLEDAGVTLWIEPLNARIDHAGEFLTGAEEGLKLTREAESPNVRMVYDIYHQQITEGNIIPTITKNLDLIEHVHAAGHPGRIEPWKGESYYPVILRALEQAGYKGACGLEFRPTEDAEEDLRVAPARLTGTAVL